MSVETIVIAGEEVVVDSANLAFDEDTLTLYLTKESGFYDNFGGQLARAERYLMLCEKQMEDIYAEKFVFIKDSQGGSDVLTTSRVKSDPDYQKARDLVVEAKYRVSRLKNHLKAWDKNHENAQSLGYTIRKSWEKLGTDIKLSSGDVIQAWNHSWQQEESDRKRAEKACDIVGYIDDTDK